jgi:hypothetical protein
LVKITLATITSATSATEAQHDDNRNASDGKVLQRTPVLAMAQARSRKCTKVASRTVLTEIDTHHGGQAGSM